MTGAERKAKRAEERLIATSQYNAKLHREIFDELPYYRVETKLLSYFSGLEYSWDCCEDAIRYCNEQVRVGLEARVVKEWYVKSENTMYVEPVYVRK